MVTPKLKSLLIRDFRSISGDWLVPLDAEVVLIHGQNGAGKTSMLSALELAATGKISYLDRLGDADYQNHLNHRGTRSGEVTLAVTGSLELDSGSAVVTDNGVESNPLLSGQLAETFIERCFLPQATLGRLFEVYAPQKTSTDTPLIRFVKEVLGLDALDALIDGLYPAGDIRRVQKLSQCWKDANSLVGELSTRRNEVARAQAEVQSKFGVLSAELIAHLGLDAETMNELERIAAAVERLTTSQSVNESKSATIRALLIQLDAVESTLNEENLASADPNEREVTSGLGDTEKRYEEWRASRSGPLVAWFDDNAANDGHGDPTPPELIRALRMALLGMESRLDESRHTLQALSDLGQRLVDARGRVNGLDDELRLLAAERHSVSDSSAAAGLASVLVSILEYVDGEVCPVCSQEFNLDGSLRSHIQEEIDGLNTDAARLVEMETRRARLEAEQKALLAQIMDDEARLAALGDPVTLESQVLAQTKNFGDLKALEPLAEAGLLLWDTLDRLRNADIASARRRNLLDRCLTDIEQVARHLGVNSPRGLLAQQVASLRAQARGQLDELEVTRRHVLDATRRLDELVEMGDQLARMSDLMRELESQLAQLSSQVNEATRRKESASELRKRAEELRTAITTRVFNDQLNGTWSRIFGALVPSEPFIPQFREIPAGLRSVRVDIETRHRDGLEGATPAAMLSQGNLNTAALSLFIALHFAVSPRLPWLIFDDPVQSMDDLHISNFASMVKQLTRRNGRQVVIAVHDRELFDYLSLELTPASPGEELLAIVLDRTYGQSIVTHERLKFNEDTSLSPSPAA